MSNMTRTAWRGSWRTARCCIRRNECSPARRTPPAFVSTTSLSKESQTQNHRAKRGPQGKWLHAPRSAGNLGAPSNHRSLGGRPAAVADQDGFGAEQVHSSRPPDGIRRRDEQRRASRESGCTRPHGGRGGDRFLSEYLADEKGRAEKTIADYRYLHQRWFSPAIGAKPVKRVDSATIDSLFGAMRRAGLSASRLNQAKALYAPFFRWAKRRGMTTRNPMAEFQLPTSTFRSSERTPPEIRGTVPAPVDGGGDDPRHRPAPGLGAVTGIRRGELVGITRSGVAWRKNQITIASAITSSGKVKTTKTRRSRTFHIDAETTAMLKRHCDLMDERAAAAGVEMAGNPFLFSLAEDCSTPMPPAGLRVKWAQRTSVGATLERRGAVVL